MSYDAFDPRFQAYASSYAYTANQYTPQAPVPAPAPTDATVNINDAFDPRFQSYASSYAYTANEYAPQAPVPAPVPVPVPDPTDATVNINDDVDASAPVPRTSNPTATTATAAAAFYPPEAPDEEYEESLPPWERDGWVPTTKSGKQLTPNMIRNKLQKYINECKANGTASQTSIIERMGVNNNSFRRFMNPATYKGKWSAVENGTYWAAAKLLEEVRFENEKAKKAARTSGAKRKAESPIIPDHSAPPKKSKAEAKMEALMLISRILAVEGVSHEDGVFDSCPQLVKKTNEFLCRDGVTKADFLAAVGGINSNSLNRFLAAKKQDQCGNVAYRETYVFFEKYRILENQPKSAARLKNEAEHPKGFSLHKRRQGTYKILF